MDSSVCVEVFFTGSMNDVLNIKINCTRYKIILILKMSESHLFGNYFLNPQLWFEGGG